MTFTAFVFPKLRTPKTWSDICLKSPISEDASRSNMVNVPKPCRNLHHSSFIRLIGHWQGIFVRKSFSYWHAKSGFSLFTHWLPMKTILFLIETIYRYQFRCNYRKNKNTFSQFFADFFKSRLNLENFEKKDDPISFCISKITDSQNVVR